MKNKYYIVYNPLNYNLMDLVNQFGIDLFDVIAYLSGKPLEKINENNWFDYIDFSADKQRTSLIDTLAVELYPSVYIQNQLACLKPDTNIIMADGKRRSIADIIKEKKRLPEAVFISSMSSNFPAAAAAAVLLNHGNIPVIIGGIHVSTSPEDVDTFIRNNCKNKNLVSLVKGGGDKKTLTEVISDLESGSLKPAYTGYKLIEDGVWGDFENIERIDPLKINLLQKIPVIKYTPLKNFRINPAAPFVGCPYSCHFCSISTLPKSISKMQFRDFDDFINELLNHQKDGVDFTNRFFFFTTDNLLLARKRLVRLLKKIIKSDLNINYAVQISIEIADDPELMKLMRKSGATHLFIGMESLNLENLKYINKHVVSYIDQSEMSVRDYYASKIKKMHEHGFSIHGSFIFGLPYDYFNSASDNTGVETAKFCRENKIGIQPSTITDLPGSVFFNESQKNEDYLYGAKGSCRYFLSLCAADLIETNKTPPDSLMNSPLITAVMAYEASRITGSYSAAAVNAFYAFIRSFTKPTKNRNKAMERFKDSVCSAVSQVAVSLFKEHFDSLFKSRTNYKGVLQRLYENESDPEVKLLVGSYVKKFSKDFSQTKDFITEREELKN
jgi:radical SAM superfamily enzyme YgiQ (UPF0313 family)